MKRHRHQKQAQARGHVVRVTVETFQDYRWWRYQDTEPECGYVEDTIRHVEPLEPSQQKPARKSKAKFLSKTKLRKLCASTGLRGEQLRETVEALRTRPLSADAETLAASVTYLGWSKEALVKQFGRRLSNAIIRHIAPLFLVFDEFGYYMSASLSEMFRQARAYAPSTEAGAVTVA